MFLCAIQEIIGFWVESDGEMSFGCADVLEGYNFRLFDVSCLKFFKRNFVVQFQEVLYYLFSS